MKSLEKMKLNQQVKLTGVYSNQIKMNLNSKETIQHAEDLDTTDYGVEPIRTQNESKLQVQDPMNLKSTIGAYFPIHNVPRIPIKNKGRI